MVKYTIHGEEIQKGRPIIMSGKVLVRPLPRVAVTFVSHELLHVVQWVTNTRDEQQEGKSWVVDLFHLQEFKIYQFWL